MGRVRAEVPLGHILMDRIPLDPTTLKYAKLIEKSVDFPAIKVQWLAPGRLLIKDGRHRWTAHKLAGKKTIKVKYGKVTEEDPHRRRRSDLLEQFGNRHTQVSQRKLSPE